MQNIATKLSTLNWEQITATINDKGFAVIPKLVTGDDCDALVTNYHLPGLYRKTVVMERYRFGAGEYKYFNYPLPGLVQSIREAVYPYLAPVANAWMKALKIEQEFPATFERLRQLCNGKGQTKPTPLILKYGQGGHNTLHQDLYGEIFFPLQAVLFLNTPGEDYTGGEFIILQQTPRAQSKAIVLRPEKGDLLLFTTNFRPVKGSKGYYRVNMKHGVSEVHAGNRHTLGVIFHDALT